MERDFTLSKYEQLIESITDGNYITTTVRNYLLSAPSKCIILRHDVDRDVQLALKMAETESKYDIQSTYYFRHTEDVFKPEIMLKIANLGHEIGYHYETMDKAKGNIDKAAEIFNAELEEFRDFVDIDTVCMHGNPLFSWSNRDLWNKYKLSDFNLIGEPYISIDYSKTLYLTDTGRTWANKNIRVKDKVSANNKSNNLLVNNVSSTDDVIELIQNEITPQICILVHPNRWSDNYAKWVQELILQNIKNIGKKGIIYYRDTLSSQIRNTSTCDKND